MSKNYRASGSRALPLYAGAARKSITPPAQWMQALKDKKDLWTYDGS